MVSSFEEDLPHHWFEHAEQYAIETARHKAMDVAKVCAAQRDKPPVDLIISADTVSDPSLKQQLMSPTGHHVPRATCCTRQVLLLYYVCYCHETLVEVCCLQLCDHELSCLAYSDMLHRLVCVQTQTFVETAFGTLLTCCRLLTPQIVEHAGYILEKPEDVTHARKMLQRWVTSTAGHDCISWSQHYLGQSFFTCPAALT